MNAELPSSEILSLLGRMFAGHTGMSLKQMEAFFGARKVKVVVRPDDLRPRRSALERALGGLSPRGRLATIESLLNYQGPMRHGHPPEADKARLRAWLRDS